MYIQICMCMRETLLMNKEAISWKESQGRRACGSSWRKEREGGNVNFNLQSKNKKGNVFFEILKDLGKL